MNFIKKFLKKEVKISFMGEENIYISTDESILMLVENLNGSIPPKTICNELKEELNSISTEDIKGKIRGVLETLNKKYLTKNEEICVTLAYKNKNRYIITNIGNNRCYIVNEQELKQLTEDDTQAWNLFKSGAMSEEQMEKTQLRNVLTNYLGKNEKLSIDIIEYYYQPKEKLFLVTQESVNKYSDTKLYDILSFEIEGVDLKLQGEKYILKKI